MSYSFTTEPLDKPVNTRAIFDQFKAKVEEHPDGPNWPHAEIVEHLDHACQGLAHMLDGLGEWADKVTVSINGHAEPGHGQRPSWAPECMTVSASIARRPIDPSAEDSAA